MYIEQLKSRKQSLWLYVPFTLGFLFLIVINYAATLQSDNSTKEIIQVLIEQVGKPLTFIITVLPLSALCIILLLWVRFIHQQSITSLTTSRPKTDWSRIFFSFSLWSVIMIAFTAVDYYLNPTDYVVTFEFSKFIIFFIIAIILIPLQTSFEEYLLRGYLMQGIGLAAKNRWIPLITTSLLFGLMHIANPEVGDLGVEIMIFYIGTGFLLGVMTLMDEGLELALGFHAANNLMACFLVSSESSALQTDAILKSVSENSENISQIYFQVFIIFPILLLIFARKYKWKNWKYQLTKSI